MKKTKRLEFSKDIKQKILERSKNSCERCGYIFEEPQKGEFHHIKSIVFGGDASLENCSLLCRKCHTEAPNVKNEMDFLVYKHYFLRFALFKEAIQYYKTEDKLELYFKIAQDIAKEHYKTK